MNKLKLNLCRRVVDHHRKRTRRSTRQISLELGWISITKDYGRGLIGWRTKSVRFPFKTKKVKKKKFYTKQVTFYRITKVLKIDIYR